MIIRTKIVRNYRAEQSKSVLDAFLLEAVLLFLVCDSEGIKSQQ